MPTHGLARPACSGGVLRQNYLPGHHLSRPGEHLPNCGIARQPRASRPASRYRHQQWPAEDTARRRPRRLLPRRGRRAPGACVPELPQHQGLWINPRAAKNMMSRHTPRSPWSSWATGSTSIRPSVPCWKLASTPCERIALLASCVALVPPLHYGGGRTVQKLFCPHSCNGACRRATKLRGGWTPANAPSACANLSNT